MTEKIYAELEHHLKSRRFFMFEQSGFKNFKHEIRIGGYEIDFWCERKTPTGKKRTYIFELKEHDFNKVLTQALLRKPFADYTSIVMVHTDPGRLCYKIGKNFDLLMENGLGVYYYFIDRIWRILYPKWNRNKEVLGSDKEKKHPKQCVHFRNI